MKLKSSYLKWGFAAAGLIFFLLLTYLVCAENGAPLALDNLLRYPVYELRRDGLSSILIFDTYCGNWQTITALCSLLLVLSFFWKPFGKSLRNSYGISLAAGSLLSLFAYTNIKALIERPRPDAALHLISQGGYSFPSGHAMTSLVFYGLLLIWIRRFLSAKKKSKTITAGITVLLSVFIFLIGFSRIYVGVHYPSDVLAGWSIGACILMVLSSVFRPKKSL